jgi:phosphoribosylformimino-5-aminoimidazole carboxamide ribotide isomerase
MLVIPAIDLLGGRVVRLERGQREHATVYSDDPAGVARGFCDAGATRLHVVDLDGAFGGAPQNQAAIVQVVAAARGRAAVQMGGGLRDLAACAAGFDAGAAAVVLGTAAAKQPQVVRAACARWPGRIVVAVDAKGGLVAVEGWAETTARPAEELAREMVALGAAAILYTDVARDGMRTGPAVEATARLAGAVAPVPVIASGGVAKLDDLRALASAGVPRCIVGRALYERAFTLAQAIAAAA